MSAAPSNPCATCGVCCHSYLVPVCGYDVWLISREQQLSPETFLVAFPQPEGGPETFRLAAGGQNLALALDKRGRFRAKGDCIFLVRLAGGHKRCGIYDHRPSVCRAYPMRLETGTVSQREDVLCAPGSWPAAAVARPAWRAALQRQRMHFDVYHEVVARWNARVAARPEARFLSREYFSYLLNVYDRLAALDAQMGAAAVAAVQESWPHLSGPRGDLSVLRQPGTDLPWLDYLEAVRPIVDCFYPEVPRQALLNVTLTERVPKTA